MRIGSTAKQCCRFHVHTERFSDHDALAWKLNTKPVLRQVSAKLSHKPSVHSLWQFFGIQEPLYLSIMADKITVSFCVDCRRQLTWLLRPGDKTILTSRLIVLEARVVLFNRKLQSVCQPSEIFIHLPVFSDFYLLVAIVLFLNVKRPSRIAG